MGRNTDDGRERELAGARHALRAAVRPVPDTIDDVIEQLEAIERVAARLVPRGDDDGIACFTRLYLKVTRAVKVGEKNGLFHAGDFILRLDVFFARRYLDALRDDLLDGDPRRGPDCWRVLFDARREDDVPPWGFAALGVNAHVNFDLTFALLDVWEDEAEKGISWSGELVAAQHEDYDTINDVFADLMDGLLASFRAPGADFGGHGSLVDTMIDAVAESLVRRTRSYAWEQAITYWADRDTDGYREGPTRAMDRDAATIAWTLRTLASIGS